MRSFGHDPVPAASSATPRLSVVLPVFGVADCLAECLDSILAQSPRDVEVVAVDDCSPDGCGGILDWYADRDPRLRVLHLRHNVGLGEARNLGFDRAHGEYVWFVDSDDRLAEGGVAAVLERLAVARPDVLIVDFAQFHADGRLERDVWRQQFREPPRGATFRLADRPSLLNTIMSAWNKVVRREYLRELGLRFGTGFYEDIAVTYPMLLATERLALLDRVCYHYRRGRGGAISQTTSLRHFEVFKEYERIFAFVAADTGGPRVGDELTAAVFDRTVRHALTVLATPGLIPAGSRRAFFHRLSRHFRSYRPHGYHHPAGLRGIRYRLVEQDAYRAYALLQPLNRARITLRRALKRPRPAGSAAVSSAADPRTAAAAFGTPSPRGKADPRATTDASRTARARGSQGC